MVDNKLKRYKLKCVWCGKLFKSHKKTNKVNVRRVKRKKRATKKIL